MKNHMRINGQLFRTNPKYLHFWLWKNRRIVANDACKDAKS